MPAPGTRRRIEFGVPDDERRLLIRVWLDGDWNGDLLFLSSDARSAFLDALTSGALSVIKHPIPLTDVCTELETASATSPGPGEVQGESTRRSTAFRGF